MTVISSVEEFASLVLNGDEESQSRIRNDQAPQEVWLRIIASRPDLIRAVTLNKHLPECVIRTLAAHANADVRFDVANRRALPDDLFDKLAGDSDETVRARIAWNKKTPKAILVRLSEDRCPLVSEPAKKRLASC